MLPSNNDAILDPVKPDEGNTSGKCVGDQSATLATVRKRGTYEKIRSPALVLVGELTSR